MPAPTATPIVAPCDSPPFDAVALAPFASPSVPPLAMTTLVDVSGAIGAMTGVTEDAIGMMTAAEEREEVVGMGAGAGAGVVVVAAGALVRPRAVVVSSVRRRCEHVVRPSRGSAHPLHRQQQSVSSFVVPS